MCSRAGKLFYKVAARIMLLSERSGKFSATTNAHRYY
jgi:hypothetical protein